MSTKLRTTDWRIFATLALTFTSVAAFAHDYAKADIFIEHPWARPGRAATVPAAVYFDISNRGGEADRLVSAKTDRAEHVEIHLSEKTKDGRVTMKPVEYGVAVPANAELSFETGAYHVMLIGLNDGALKEGESFPLVLTFEKAGDVEVVIKVEDRDTKAPHAEGH